MINNRVIIRVWNSGLNGGEDVGHVSIQTPNAYMSLWPKGSASGKIMQLFEIRPHELLKAFENDLKSENRPPEITICLYSLNVERMNDKFIEFQNSLVGWTMFGSNRPSNNQVAESCASLALAILRAGGLPLDYSSFSSSVTPDKMAEAIIEVKKNELKEYPETVEFKFDLETDIDKRNYEKYACVIL